MSFGPQVAFVDDIKSEIIPLERVLQQQHTGTIFFDAAPERSKFPEKTYDSIKVLFLDLYYSAQFEAYISAQWVKSIIPPNSNYALIVWSKDTHKTNELLEILNTLERKPAYVETWQKTEFDLNSHNFTDNINYLLSQLSNKVYEEEDIFLGQILEVAEDGVYINCRLNSEKPTFQVRRFDYKLLEGIRNCAPGTFVRINISSTPGARKIVISEEKEDRSKYFEQPDFFNGLEGNSFFIQG
ncbi:MAG TPA: hypothetical protein VGN00_12950 [Puia sp.]|jgi:hypothetical protein